MDIGSMRWAAMAALVMGVSGAAAQPFTYQGSLSDGGQPADGEYDVRVTLLNEGGGTVAGPLTFNDVLVDEGVFNVELDFGAGSFNGDTRLLGLEFRAGASTGGFTELLPNTPINPTPYALYALDAFSEVTRSNSVLRIGEGTGTDVAIINPAMINGGRINSSTEFQVNFDGGNDFGGMYINGSQPGDIPFVGFSINRAIAAFIDYNPDEDQIRFWDGDVFEPIVRMGPSAVSILPNLEVDGDIVVASDSAIRGSSGVLGVAGTLSASSEVRSGGDMVVGDDIEVDGDIAKDYGVDQYFEAIPIAFGTINSTGTVRSATPNLTSVYNAAAGRYEISVSGQSLTINNYSIQVTPIASSSVYATATTSGGDAVVFMFTGGSGALTQSGFSITIMQTSPAVTRLPGK